MVDEVENEEIIVEDDSSETQADRENRSSKATFPVVGIGASAGGLDAFRQFFTAMPPDSGMAFVIIQHLDPTHKSMLVELIDRFTRMQVFQVVDGIKMQPNCIYIIPPNHDMTVKGDTLRLTKAAAARGFRLPIDSFFRSLAEERREGAICIVLSGTGTDGSLGLEAIKGAGGFAIVQHPSSAKYDGMPHSAIATGLADLVLPPSQMPGQLIHYVDQALRKNGNKVESISMGVNDALQPIMVILRTETGHDFSQYKHNTITRRIERRMVLKQINNIQQYVQFLSKNPEEADILFRELLIGVTCFFRDKDVFEMLKRKALPLIFKDRHVDEPIRVWVTGCATGEEAYSLAILLCEYMEDQGLAHEVQIFATDIDPRAIAKARQGLYPDNIAADVSPERLNRFFTKEEEQYRVVKEVRDMVVFALQSVIRDPPFSRLDLISCRNVLIYLGAELQHKVISLFHYALRPGGILFLGTSETLGGSAELFNEIDRRSKIFRRVNKHYSTENTPFNYNPHLLASDSGINAVAHDVPVVNHQSLTERILLENFTPSSALVNEKNNIVYIHKKLGKYLDLPEGEAELNILKMADVNLRITLSSALRRARDQEEVIIHRNLRTTVRDEAHVIDVIISPVVRPVIMKGLLLILFREVEALEPFDVDMSDMDSNSDYQQRIIELEHELYSTRQYMQTLVEELETTNEELKSTNEELQSSNEELQSTNEELETAKEELQSVNEELVTVNAELHAKIDELSHSNNDLNNLLSTLDVGIIFVDLHLRIRQFNPAASYLVNLIETDIGRPLRHIVANMDYADLVKDAQEVLDTLVPFEKELKIAEGQWYWMRIRPYRTVNNTIEGVVITFAGITEQKRVQDDLRTLIHAIEQSASLIVMTDNEWHIQYVNPAFVKKTGYSLDDIEGQPLRSLKVETSHPDLKGDLWQSVENGEDWFGEFQTSKVDGTPLWVRAAISPVFNEDGEIIQFVSVADDITERKYLEGRLADADLYRMMARNMPGFAAIVFDKDLRYVKVEGSSLTSSGYDPRQMEGRTLYEVAPEGNLEKLEDIYRRALAGETVDFDITGARDENEYIGRAIPVQDKDGNIIAGMILSWDIEPKDQQINE